MSHADLRDRLGPLLFAEAPCIVAVIDASHRLVLTNPTFERIFGSREGELCYRVYKGRDEPCERCPVDEAFATGAAQVSEEDGVGCDGSPLRYSLRAVPLDSHGDPCTDPDQVERVAQIALEVTQVRELEEALSQAERLATVGLTTAGLAHTIKNILAGLEGGIYVVNSGLDKDDTDRLKGGWTMVQRYIEQVTALVRNLLRYARAQEPIREEVAPGELVDRVYELYASKSELCGVELEIDVEEGLEPIVADGETLHACLANLVSNSLDACTWDPDTDKEHHIKFSARRTDDGGVLFEVEDNGMGIPAEDQPKILQKLHTTKGIRGTGLGLLLTKKAVEEHGGTIDFESTQGQGTTFRIELPGQGQETSGTS
jgi:signal transduction histidine kinase